MKNPRVLYKHFGFYNTSLFHILSQLGITSKLQHFVDSGIGGIWLSPIYASPMVDFGYDISDFKDVDKRFGTMQDLEELIAKAKKLGVKVKKKKINS